MILQLIFAGIFKIASTRPLKNDLKSLQTTIFHLLALKIVCIGLIAKKQQTYTCNFTNLILKILSSQIAREIKVTSGSFTF